MLRFTALAAFAFIFAPAAHARYFWQSDQSIMREVCEDAIKERLKSPSSYRELSISEVTRRPATLDEYLGIHSEKQRQSRAKLMREDYKYRDLAKSMEDSFSTMRLDYVEIFVTYEASNSYGAMIKGIAKCSGNVRPDEPFDDLGVTGPAINGQTHLQWLLDSAPKP